MLPRLSTADAVRAAGGPDVLVSLVATALARVGAARFHTVVLGGSAPARNLPANVVTTYGLTETGSGVVYDGVALSTASRWTSTRPPRRSACGGRCCCGPTATAPGARRRRVAGDRGRR